MSFFSDLFKGDFSNLGTDITHSGSSLINHPDELAETVGGAAALATGGLALGGALPALGGLFGGAGAAADAGTAAAAGGDFALGDVGLPSTIGDYLGAGGNAQQGISTALGISDSGLPPNLTAFAGGGGGGGGGGVPAGGGAPAWLNPSMLTAPDAGTLGGGGGGGGTFFDSSAAAAAYGGGPSGAGGSGILDSLTNPTLGGVAKGAGVAVAGGGLLMDFLRKTGAPAQQQALQQEAGNLQSQGQQLQSYLSTGTLPPALQAQLNQATTAEKARIISGYASRGQPTDPSQNSALAQELNNVDTNAIAAMADTQTKLLQTGIQETGLSTQLYETLIKLDQGGNQQLMTAIQNFAMSLTGAGGGGGQNVKLSLG